MCELSLSHLTKYFLTLMLDSDSTIYYFVPKGYVNPLSAVTESALGDVQSL